MDAKIKIDTINMVLNYLGTRPYNEVATLVQVIRDEVLPQLQEAPPQVDE